MISWQEVTDLSAAAVRAELSAREPITVRVRGHSMRPLLCDGALVRLRRLRRGEPRVGDIVAAEVANNLVLHRVTRVRSGLVETHGDATAAPDAAVPPERVLALANGVESRAGIWLPLVAGRATGALVRTLRRLWAGGP